MSLEMKSSCELCHRKLQETDVAYICSYECTFCEGCTEALDRCPNCQGELVVRPRRGSLADASWMTADDLARFDQAWAEADVDALAKWITDDCVYSASVGPEPGKTYVGRQQVVEGFREILDYEAGGQGTTETRHLSGNRGFANWSYSRLIGNETRIVRGCDFFVFQNKRICRKDAFVKISATAQAVKNAPVQLT